MNTDVVHEIEKAFNDLDTHRNLHVLDKYVPRGSQEFREALIECQNDVEAVAQPRERSNTIDTTYKKHPSVHFASSLVTSCGKKNRSRDDLHLHPEGILRHSRERSNTYDASTHKPRKTIGTRSPLCDSESSTDQSLHNSSAERKADVNGLQVQKVDSDIDSKKSNDQSLSPLRHQKSETTKVSPKTLRKLRTDSPKDGSKSKKLSTS